VRVVLVAIILVVVFAVAVVFAGLWARGSTEVASFHEQGVCIEAPGPNYTIEGSANLDGSSDANSWQVILRSNEGPRMNVRIGPDARVNASDVARARAGGGSPVMVAGAPNEYVLADSNPRHSLAHIQILEPTDARMTVQLIRGVHFCDDGQ
jgi:hypothetical protein